MRRWAAVMPQGCGGMVGNYWNATTEAWFKVNPQMFLSFPYAGMDFHGDPDMGLPFGYAWGPIGMFCYVFCIYLSTYVFMYFSSDTDIILVTF